MKKTMIAIIAGVLATGACSKKAAPTTPPPQEPTATGQVVTPTEDIEPGPGSSDMRPTNSPKPPDTEENRTGRSRTN